MKKEVSNLSASIHRRILNVARNKGEHFENLLYRYVAERFLYRLSKSQYKDKFLLKGAFLFILWEEIPHRHTRDIDFLGALPNDIKLIENIFKEISLIPVEDDALEFDESSILGESIMEEHSYVGVRIKQTVKLGKAVVTLQTDIGFGDLISPAPEEHNFPTLLDMPAPKIKVYPIYTVIAEKLQTIATKGIDNSRLKDFYDVWCLIRDNSIDPEKLTTSIITTFTNRGTEFSLNMPIGLTKEFSLNEQKILQWSAFIRKNQINTNNVKLDTMVSEIHDYFKPILDQLYSQQALHINN